MVIQFPTGEGNSNESISALTDETLRALMERIKAGGMPEFSPEALERVTVMREESTGINYLLLQQDVRRSRYLVYAEAPDGSVRNIPVGLATSQRPYDGTVTLSLFGLDASDPQWLEFESYQTLRQIQRHQPIQAHETLCYVDRRPAMFVDQWTKEIGWSSTALNQE